MLIRPAAILLEHHGPIQLLRCSRGPSPLDLPSEHGGYPRLLEPETLARHALSVVDGGAIIFDADDAETPLERMPFLDERAREALGASLQAHGFQPSTAGLLAEIHQRGVQTFAVPFDEIIHRIVQELRVPQVIADRTLNTVAVAVSCAVLKYDLAYLAKALRKVFAGRTHVIEMNLQAVELSTVG